MKQLHIALITTYPPSKGSLNEYAYHFVKACSQKDEIAKLTLLTDKIGESEAYDIEPYGKVPIEIIPCWEMDNWLNVWHIVKAVRQVKPDVVLFNIQFASFGQTKSASALGLLTPMFMKLMGYPTIVLLHNIMETVSLRQTGFAGNKLMSTVIRSIGTIVTRLVLTADLVALTMPNYVMILKEKYKVDNVILAPHGAFETPDPPDVKLENERRILTFGKFGTYKKVELLIEAVEILQQSGFPNLELVIAGSDNPNTKGYLAGVAEKYAHVKNLTFTGYVPEEDVPRHFKQATIVVFPYTSTTGSSGVLHQAGSYGKAVVLPNIGDLAELIAEEGYTGNFFEPNSKENLAEAMADLLSRRDKRHKVGQQNYLASCGISIEDIVDWYVIHCQNLVGEQANEMGNFSERTDSSAGIMRSF